MDAHLFDSLARSLTAARSRRGALASLLVGTLGLLGLTETAAKKKKGKKKKKKTRTPTTTPPPPTSPPPPSGPTCIADGVKNGSETGVDCGGGCGRCGNGQGCLSRDDCAGAFCANGTCQACAGVLCGRDADGDCDCFTPSTGGPAFCMKRENSPPLVNECSQCPPGTVCAAGAGGQLGCPTLCGAA